MEIWVDADACPLAIKEVLFRAAERTGIRLTLVACQRVEVPSSSFIRSIRVPPGPDAADSEIIRNLSDGDLVVTADIPLAAEVVERGGYALNPRGTFYTVENIRAHLSSRDFLDILRASGIETGGPPALTRHHRQSFANHLDTFLTRRTKHP